MKREQLTQSDVEKIQAEIDERILKIRPQLIEEVQAARSLGDLSENFEYYAAKKAKNENERRIRYLENVLKYAEVISDYSNEGEVGLNNHVTVYFEEDDEEQKFKIVTSIRGNSIKNMISNESPLGEALMGKKVGDRVLVKVNESYSYYVVIRKIEETTDDEDDQIKSF
ncbi:MAG: transcription elongation factor GreA [Lachnospiraceae bacterium]|nr:transcription elongation factor GreA [Lachnospiraceae bacterium]